MSLTRSRFQEKDKHEENLTHQKGDRGIEAIAEGMLNKEIAKALYISETVKNHISNIFKKPQCFGQNAGCDIYSNTTSQP